MLNFSFLIQPTTDSGTIKPPATVLHLFHDYSTSEPD